MEAMSVLLAHGPVILRSARKFLVGAQGHLAAKKPIICSPQHMDRANTQSDLGKHHFLLRSFNQAGAFVFETQLGTRVEAFLSRSFHSLR